MIKSGNTLFVLLFVCCALFLSSCGRKGCTDSDASNYSPRAKKDDETCRYEASVVFWVHDSSAQQMLADTIESLAVYLDGYLVGTIKNNEQNFSVAPDCDAAKAVTVKQDLFVINEKAVSYHVIDNNSVKRFAGVITFYGGKCEPFQLVYYP